MPKMHVNCSDNDDLTPCSDKERRLTEFFYHYELLRIELNSK